MWDSSQIIAEYSASGVRGKRYAYLPFSFNPIQMEDSNGIYNIHTDHLDTARFITDTTQKIVWSSKQESFGKMQVNEDPDSNGVGVVFNYRFPGQYYDAESGLYQNYLRDYDPTIGRYIQSDPLGLAGGINIYGYAYQNPINNFDPDGQRAITWHSLINFNPVIRAGRTGWQLGGAVNGALDSAGIYPGIMVYDWINGDGSVYSVESQVENLNENVANDESASVPWPDRRKGKWTAICKVVDQGTCPTASGNKVGWGFGIANNMSDARKAAEKMAKDMLGSTNVHHPSCKCTSPQGVQIPLCRSR